ncbi:hypothetical protein C6497_04170 [Candidatus Poribacteria bacterium]|nr:MAG: hypothetical protein C6497_04170 [Candidatus Poribacteria bacterium]
MHKKRSNLWNIYTVIFVICLNPITYGQEKNPESQGVIIIEKIHEMENRLRDHIDKKFKEQDANITNLGKEVAANSKAIEYINEDIKELQGTLTWISRGVIGVLIINIGWYLIQRLIQNKSNNQAQGTLDSTSDQVSTAKYPDDTQTDMSENMGESA